MVEPEDITSGFSQMHENSRVAARRAAQHRAIDRQRIVDYVRSLGEAGATCDEIEVALDMRHQTCGPRCTELKRDGLLRETNLRRNTRSGSPAAVLVEGDGVPHPKASRLKRGRNRPKPGPVIVAAARMEAERAYHDFLADWRPAVEGAGGDSARFKQELDVVVRLVRKVALLEEREAAE